VKFICSAGLLVLLATQNIACKPRTFSNTQNAYVQNSSSDPVYFESQFFKTSGLEFVRKLDNLPLESTLPTAWSDTFLPNRWAGAAVRWYMDNNLGDMDVPLSRPDMWTYKLNTPNELKSLNVEQLKRLSPAEKFDILMSRYDYPLTTVERRRTKPTNEDWEGTCNGWSTAALKFAEPSPIVVTNAEGIAIPFASSDIKSLLMLHQYFIDKYPKFAALGDRCFNVPSADSSQRETPRVLTQDAIDACSDSNAGSFHLVVTNMLGRAKMGLVFDIDRDEDVWNQPVYKYSAKILSRTASSAKVSMKVWYAEETMPDWNPRTANKTNIAIEATYNYELELAPDGTITGGKWMDGQALDYKMYPTYHPDFVWYADGEPVQYKRATFPDANKQPFTLSEAIDFGGVVDLWEVSVGRKSSFRSLQKMR
jgi:hypothetical protein